MPQDIVNTEDCRNSSTETLFHIAQEARGLSARAISILPTLVYANSLGQDLSVIHCMDLFRDAVHERLSRHTN